MTTQTASDDIENLLSRLVDHVDTVRGRVLDLLVDVRGEAFQRGVTHGKLLPSDESYQKGWFAGYAAGEADAKGATG